MEEVPSVRLISMRATHRFRVDPAIPAAFADLPRLASKPPMDVESAGSRPLRRTRLRRVGGERQRPGPAPRTDQSRTVGRACRRRPSRPTRRRDGRRTRPGDHRTALVPGARTSPLDLVAYFSPEFGLSETFAQYSGGLGILAGDHLKAASDLGIPLVAVGLLYREGYFRQKPHRRLLAGGAVPRPRPERVGDGADRGADQPRGRRRARRGRDLARRRRPGAALSARHRPARQQRGGDRHHRPPLWRGRGASPAPGDRARHRRRACPPGARPPPAGLPHQRGSRRLPVARAHPRAASATDSRSPRRSKPSAAVGCSRPTPRFRPVSIASPTTCCTSTSAASRHIAACRSTNSGPRSPSRRAGRDPLQHGGDGARLAGRANGVAALHGEVSRSMFQGMWPDIPADEVPIGSITNGVHAHTWVVARDHRDCSPMAVGPSGTVPMPATWDAAHKIDDAVDLGGSQPEAGRVRRASSATGWATTCSTPRR